MPTEAVREPQAVLVQHLANAVIELIDKAFKLGGNVRRVHGQNAGPNMRPTLLWRRVAPLACA